VIFRGKFRGICGKNDFSKLFPRKNAIFPNFFFWGGGIFRGIFPGKMYKKNRPQGKNFRSIFREKMHEKLILGGHFGKLYFIK
jgi:hypothetical protein